jgi:hypothetical protein
MIGTAAKMALSSMSIRILKIRILRNGWLAAGGSRDRLGGELQGFGSLADFEKQVSELPGVTVFADDPTWVRWAFTRREQVWSQGDGTKLVSFEPRVNMGASTSSSPCTSCV